MTCSVAVPCPGTYCGRCGGKGTWYVGWFWWKTKRICGACKGSGKPSAAERESCKLARPSPPPPPPRIERYWKGHLPPPPPDIQLLREDQDPNTLRRRLPPSPPADERYRKVCLPNLDAAIHLTEPRYHEDGTPDLGRPSDITHRQMLRLKRVLDTFVAGLPHSVMDCHARDTFVTVHDTTELDRA